jgi:hypothetical protein
MAELLNAAATMEKLSEVLEHNDEIEPLVRKRLVNKR